MKVAAIVEGDGEVAALPILLRRLAAWRTPESFVDPLPPIRVRRDRFLNRNEEFSRYLLLAAAKCTEDGWILLILDADDDCPAELGPQICIAPIYPDTKVNDTFVVEEEIGDGQEVAVGR